MHGAAGFLSSWQVKLTASLALNSKVAFFFFVFASGPLVIVTVGLVVSAFARDGRVVGG